MTPATSSSAPSPNGETDMNDIDIEEGPDSTSDDLVALIADLRRCATNAMEGKKDWRGDGPLVHIGADTAKRIADAIETGRHWETIARQLSEGCRIHAVNDGCSNCASYYAAFRVLADRTPSPHHDGGV